MDRSIATVGVLAELAAPGVALLVTTEEHSDGTATPVAQQQLEAQFVDMPSLFQASGALALQANRTTHGFTFSASPSATPSTPGPELSSPNWAGYIDLQDKTPFSEVAGRFIVPAVTCRETPADDPAKTFFWVGFDGWLPGPDSVEQDGIEASCTTGKGDKPDVRYSAWWEMFPNPPHKIPLKVFKGNDIALQVNYVDSGDYVMSVNNLTRRRAYTKPVPCPVGCAALRGSAEWVVERPAYDGPEVSYNGVPEAAFAPLSHWQKFRMYDLSLAYPGLNPDPLSSPDTSVQPIEMTDSSGNRLLATVSNPLNPDDSFTATWFAPQ